MLDYYIFIVIRAVIENCGSCGLQYVIADIFTCAEQIDSQMLSFISVLCTLIGSPLTELFRN